MSRSNSKEPCNHAISVTVRGKTRALVSKGQMQYLLEKEGQRLRVEEASLSAEQLEARLRDFAENCGYATTEQILSMMTPEERSQWETNYRFGGTSRRMGAE
jgi:hypothetical protein